MLSNHHMVLLYIVRYTFPKFPDVKPTVMGQENSSATENSELLESQMKWKWIEVS